MSEFKPCPFCGGEARTVLGYKKSWSDDEYIPVVCIVCEKCEARVDDWSDDAVVEKWNTRAEELVIVEDLNMELERRKNKVLEEKEE